jgi:predicted nucleotidyltransferase
MIREKRDEILRIAHTHGARNVRLFGSIARGEGKPESDIDVLVEMEPGRSLLDMIAIKQDLEDLLGRKVDIVTEAAVSPYIRNAVVNGAVNL